MGIKKEFGEKIKRMRKQKGLTQEQLAEKIDISPRNLSGIEVGSNFVKAETLEKIIAALETTTEELFANEHLDDSEVLISKINSYLDKIKNDKRSLEKIYKIIKIFSN